MEPLGHDRKVVARDDRSDFRLLARCFDGCKVTDDEWRKSRRALVSLVRNRLGMIPETPDLLEELEMRGES